MVKTIAFTVAALLGLFVAAVLILAATKPDTFRIQRTTNIKAPAEKIYPLIIDLRGWSAWSPYEKKDPAMKRTFSGAASGLGAVYEWAGDKNVGTGRMEVIDTTAPSRVVIKLDFLAPFEGHNTAEFIMVPSGDTTAVTWAMYGPQPFVSKVMGLFVNLDNMVGKDFAAGLANLKTVAEN